MWSPRHVSWEASPSSDQWTEICTQAQKYQTNRSILANWSHTQTRKISRIQDVDMLSVGGGGLHICCSQADGFYPPVLHPATSPPGPHPPRLPLWPYIPGIWWWVPLLLLTICSAGWPEQEVWTGRNCFPLHTKICLRVHYSLCFMVDNEVYSDFCYSQVEIFTASGLEEWK